MLDRGKWKTTRNNVGICRKGSSIYDVHTEGDRLRWMHVGGQGRVVKPHVDVHTEN